MDIKKLYLQLLQKVLRDARIYIFTYFFVVVFLYFHKKKTGHKQLFFLRVFVIRHSSFRPKTSNSSSYRLLSFLYHCRNGLMVSVIILRENRPTHHQCCHKLLFFPLFCLRLPCSRVRSTIHQEILVLSLQRFVITTSLPPPPPPHAYKLP